MIIAVNLFALFILSLLIHLFLLIIIKLGMFGLTVKSKVDYILKNKIYLFNIFVFLVSLIILHNSMLYLDGDKNVIVETVSINNGTFKISGEAFNSIFNNLGASAVFVAGARIAVALVAKKQALSTLPKIGVIGATGTGFTVSFKVVNNILNNTLPTNTKTAKPNIEVLVEDVTINSKSINKGIPSEIKNNLLNERLSTNKNLNLNTSFTNNDVHISSTPQETKSIMDYVNETEHDWVLDLVVSSPLEQSEISNPIKNYLIESFTNNLTLHFIITYLLFMFITIFTCKFIIEQGYQFNWLKQNRLGNFIHFLLMKYIYIWKNRANLWLYIIGFSLFFFNLIGTYSIYHAITVITNHL